jgi:adenine phosphoribosyltransferase
VKRLVFLVYFFFFTTFLAAHENPCDWIKDYIVIVHDFPKPGVTFRCYHSLLRDPVAFRTVIQTFAARYRTSNLDAIIGLDARGFIFGSALAYELGVPFVMIRKSGKLPGKVEKIPYDLHYGKDTFEIEADSIQCGSRVLIIDDTLATGGTSKAACELVEKQGAEIFEVAFLMELTFLQGREKLAYPVFSLVSLD